MNRTGQQRLNAILPALERYAEFEQRIKDAEGDAMKCADLMAEAIELEQEARGLEVVGKDGRKTVCVEATKAAHGAIYARAAYLRARGSNR